MSRVMRMLQAVWEVADGMHGAPLPLGEGDVSVRRSAEHSRELLHAAHLAELCRTEILGQYHRVKGQQHRSVSA